MVTASHNPKEYNGFKISFDLTGNAYGPLIRDFRDYTNNHKFIDGDGTSKELNILPEYIELLKSSITLGNRKVRVVVDTGNGTGSLFIKDILDQFNIDYKLLYAESDPEFPNHQPDPADPENQADLARAVVEGNYDFGFGIDGDADRVGIVDNNGKILQSDIYMALIFRSLAGSIDRAIYDVKCSMALIDDLRRLGYNQTMYRTGNSYMNKKINEENFAFGGEFSGHVWFNDKFPGFDDGIYAGLRVIEILSNTEEQVTDLLAGLNEYYATEEIKIRVTDENKFEIVENIKKYCDEKGYEYVDIDGVRVVFPDAWALVRASNTGPDLTARFESSDENRLNEIRDEFLNLLKEQA